MKPSMPVARLVVAIAVALPVLVAAQAGRPGGAGQPGAAAPPTPLGPDAPFTVAVATAVVEAAPVYMAKEGPYGPNFQYINGGVRTLANDGAHAAGLRMPRYDSGFFSMVFVKDGDRAAAKMRDLGVYVLPLKGAVRVALCGTPLREIPRLVDALAAAAAAS